jgi:hypothetical protein
MLEQPISAQDPGECSMYTIAALAAGKPVYVENQ